MPHQNFRYEFGPFRLDTAERVLTCAGEKLSITPKATDILMLLVMNAGQLVEKDELLREIWPNTFVEENNLTQNIFKLRQALGDERAVPKYIETVTRRGYRFIAPVTTTGGDSTGGQVDRRSLAAGANVFSRLVVAVLPFTKATEEEGLEQIAEGLTNGIINTLSRVSRLRVMSRSAVIRYKINDADVQQAGKELGAAWVIVGKINSQESKITVAMELVEAATGWQLWGDNFDFTNTDILEIQDVITRQLLAALNLRLTEDEEKRVTVRYTENAEAYQAYLQGRNHWSRYTRKGMEKAIEHFRCAIDRDPNYALAYAAIVDCYLRLATNYLPPEDQWPSVSTEVQENCEAGAGRINDSNPRVQLRFEWDWKGAERELRRANELKTDYPAAHQWYAAYKTTKQLYEKSWVPKRNAKDRPSTRSLPHKIPSLELTVGEQLQIYCAIVREQIDVGNYVAACRILEPWWSFGNWPNVEGLNPQSCADLLFTAGELASSIASSKQLPRGQKHSEELLSGSIALFEQLGFRRRAGEGRIELALCYYRQGLFELGRSTLERVLNELDEKNSELRSLGLIRLGCLERHAGRKKDALARLTEATAIVEVCGPWATGRCSLELASTYKDLAISEKAPDYFAEAEKFYLKALYEFEAVGNHRLAAIVENNLGCMMSAIGRFSVAEVHLFRARKTFATFEDKIRCAQVDDSIAQLYFAQQRYEEALKTIEGAVRTMETGDEDVLLAEALTTQGMIYCRLQRGTEAKRILEDAHRLAWRCGDIEGAGRPLLIMMEELSTVLEKEELKHVYQRSRAFLVNSQQTFIRERVEKCLRTIEGC